MSHSFIDRSSNYFTQNYDNEEPQKKIDPIAQLKELNNTTVREWGLFNNPQVQMFAKEENEGMQKAQVLLGQTDGNDITLGTESKKQDENASLDIQTEQKSIENTDDNIVSLSRGVFIFMSEGSFNNDDYDVRYPHFPINVYLFQKLSKAQLEQINKGKLTLTRYKDTGSFGNFKKDNNGEYQKISAKPRHDKTTYSELKADQKIGQLSGSQSGVTIGMGLDIGNKWSESQKETSKNFFINKGKIKKEIAEKLSQCAGVKGVDAAKKAAEIREEVTLTTDEVLNLLSEIIADYDRDEDRLDNYHDAVKEALNYTRYWGNTDLRKDIKDAAKDKSGVEQLKAVRDRVKTEMDKLSDSNFMKTGYNNIYHFFEVVTEMESNGKTLKIADKVKDKSTLIEDSDPTFMFIKDVTERTNNNLIGKDFKKQISGTALPDHIKGDVGSGKNDPNDKEDVEVVQQWLYNANYDVEVTGILDDKTKIAIKAFTNSIFGKEYDTIKHNKEAIKHLNKYKYIKRDEPETHPETKTNN